MSLDRPAAAAQVNVYRLAVSPAYRVLVVAIMIVFSLVGVGMMAMAFWGGAQDLPLPFVVLWCAVLIWNWHVLLGIPYEVRFDAPALISFVAVRRTMTVPAAKLHSIRPHRGGGGFYVIRHEEGKIRLLAQITGFHEVLSRIKAANPNFEVAGI